MDELYEELLPHLTKYMHKEEDLSKIEKAYLYAKAAHEGQLRKSGEPYIIHPVAVAIILADLHVMPNTICAGLLHDVVEDTPVSLDDIANEFGLDIAGIVDGVTKVTELNFVSLEKSQAENHQKMIIAMAKDIRVIVVKLADRLHNMRTLEHQKPEKRVRICQETLEIYAPLAHKLGMFKIKAELEDIALKYTNQSMYNTISSLIDQKLKSTDNYIDKMVQEIKEILKGEVSDYKIKGRIKNKYSIYKKMISQDKAFDDIYDILAIRIIVNRVDECYHVLGVIHANYTPVQKRFKDYISVPKPNMYQSLHTTIIGSDGETFEIQIRTKEMDEVAEYGIAAHWAYKENAEYSKEREQYEIAQKLKWYADLLTITTEDDAEGAEELVQTVKGDILDANVYVYTPKGEVVAIPKGATPLDFAYKIHTELGNKAVGAIVNNRIVPLTYELQNGDIVSVKTNKNSAGPSEDWLKIVKTTHAKQKIRNFLNKLNHDTLVESGKAEIDHEIEFTHCDVPLTDKFAKENFSKSGINDLEDLYAEVGKGLLAARTVIYKLMGIQTMDAELSLRKQMERSNRILTTHSESGVVVEGLSNPKIKLSNCCFPLPGDKIVGFISKGQGIAVHRDCCKNCAELEQNRLIELEWATNITRKYPTTVRIKANSSGVVVDLVNTINSCSLSIAQMNVYNNADYGSTIKIKVLVTAKAELENLIVNLRKVRNVFEVERI